MLRSSGAPEGARYLHREWTLVGWSAVKDMAYPVYVADDPTHPLLMAYDGKFKTWFIKDDMFVLAKSDSLAIHPNTIHRGEWCVLEEIFPALWRKMSDFQVLADMTGSTPDHPLFLQDIGYDFFVRYSCPKPVWYVDPSRHEVVFSGCKMQGQRYCHLCDRCFSARNFAHQHLRLHPMVRREKRCLKNGPS